MKPYELLRKVLYYLIPIWGLVVLGCYALFYGGQNLSMENFIGLMTFAAILLIPIAILTKD